MKIGVTDHAVSRYIDRVKPHFTFKQAKDEILWLVKREDAEIVPTLDYHDEERQFDAFIELAPGIALCCEAQGNNKLVGVTTIIRTGARPSVIRTRRREKRKRKQVSRQQKYREQIARKRGEARPEEGKGNGRI